MPDYEFPPDATPAEKRAFMAADSARAAAPAPAAQPTKPDYRAMMINQIPGIMGGLGAVAGLVPYTAPFVGGPIGGTALGAAGGSLIASNLKDALGMTPGSTPMKKGLASLGEAGLQTALGLPGELMAPAGRALVGSALPIGKAMNQRFPGVLDEAMAQRFPLGTPTNRVGTQAASEAMGASGANLRSAINDANISQTFEQGMGPLLAMAEKAKGSPLTPSETRQQLAQAWETLHSGPFSALADQTGNVVGDNPRQIGGQEWLQLKHNAGDIAAAPFDAASAGKNPKVAQDYAKSLYSGPHDLIDAATKTGAKIDELTQRLVGLHQLIGDAETMPEGGLIPSTSTLRMLNSLFGRRARYGLGMGMASTPAVATARIAPRAIAQGALGYGNYLTAPQIPMQPQQQAGPDYRQQLLQQTGR